MTQLQNCGTFLFLFVVSLLHWLSRSHSFKLLFKSFCCLHISFGLFVFFTEYWSCGNVAAAVKSLLVHLGNLLFISFKSGMWCEGTADTEAAHMLIPK